jgi:flavin-dependent dehydrogenase
LDNKYDVIIIGAGPAGIFAASELSQNSSLKILLLEKGDLSTSANAPPRTDLITARIAKSVPLCAGGAEREPSQTESLP